MKVIIKYLFYISGFLLGIDIAVLMGVILAIGFDFIGVFDPIVGKILAITVVLFGVFGFSGCACIALDLD